MGCGQSSLTEAQISKMECRMNNQVYYLNSLYPYR